MKVRKFICAAVGLLAALAPDAHSQYPAKPIRLVVPFPPGGTADVVARIIAQPVSQALGQQLIVDNRPSGDGAVAGTLVMNAVPDGYSLFLGTNSAMSAVPTLHRNPPYDPATDFTPISFVGKFTFFLFANPALPARTLGELIDYVRANPGKLNYGSGNTTAIIAMAQLKSLAGLDMTHVPYKGDAPATADLLGGRIHFAFMAPIPGLAQAKEGRLRILATLLTTRSTLAPEVPTMGEAGMPGVSVAAWAGLFAPAKLPRPIVDRLSREFNAALKRPDMLDQLGRQGFEAQGSTPEDLAAHVRTQIETWSRIVREAGIPVEW